MTWVEHTGLQAERNAKQHDGVWSPARPSSAVRTEPLREVARRREQVSA